MSDADVCRIFISRKKADSEVIDREIQEALEAWAPDRLEFFDDRSIKAGDKWREEIRRELEKATILLLVLTKPARDDFDWPLYEAGLFEDLNGKRQKRVICLHPVGEERPSQLGERQAVEATEENILGLLQSLYRDAEFSGTQSPLNGKVKDHQLEPIVEAIFEHIHGRPSDELKSYEYGNHWIQLVLRNEDKSLDTGVQIRSSKHSMGNLFGLNEKPVDREAWTWADIESAAQLTNDPREFNTRWISQLRAQVEARRVGGMQDRQLSGRYLAKDGRLYRPEIEVYRTYMDGTLTIDVTFSRQVQDEWLIDAGAPVALASMIALASRIRHKLIDDYLQQLPGWTSASEKREGLDALAELDEAIEGDGFFINRLSRESLGRAFANHREDGKVLGQLGRQFDETIRPQLISAVEEGDAEKAEKTLQAWKVNNEKFLAIGLRVYADLLGLGLAQAA